MFTGLVQQVGRLERISFQGDAGRLEGTKGPGYRGLNMRSAAPITCRSSAPENGRWRTTKLLFSGTIRGYLHAGGGATDRGIGTFY